MIDLKSVRDRVEDLGLFHDVGHTVSAAEAMTQFVAVPPAAYISTAREMAKPNILATGHRQRVNQTVSVLFVIAAERRDNDPVDPVETIKAALILSLTGWRPDGADSPFQYLSYALLSASEGLIWGECLFSAPYHIRAA